MFPLDVPPLRERRDDIPLLVEYFIGRYARKAGKRFRGISKQTLDRLQAYPWPGNIRELQNVIERSVIVCDTDDIHRRCELAAREAVPLPTAGWADTSVMAHERDMDRGGASRPAAAGCRGRLARPLSSGLPRLRRSNRRFAC